MNPAGLAYARQRLLDAPDMEALRRVWEGLGREYQASKELQKLKDSLKAVKNDSA